MQALCSGSKTAFASLGAVSCGRKSSMVGNVQFHRSFHFVIDMHACDAISEDCVVRPRCCSVPKFLIIF